jgi:hypothetical protein
LEKAVAQSRKYAIPLHGIEDELYENTRGIAPERAPSALAVRAYHAPVVNGRRSDSALDAREISD